MTMHAFSRVSGMILVCLATTASAQAQVQRRESLCSKEEKVAFSCQVGNKIASLCASADLSDTSGGEALQRFSRYCADHCEAESGVAG